MQSVFVQSGQAVVDLPLPHKNTSDSEGKAPMASSEEYFATVQSVTEPPAFYKPNLDLHNSFRSRHVSTREDCLCVHGMQPA